jgi:hypothetical protein
VISGDHAGSAVPHVHADIGSGEVIVELAAGGVRLSVAHSDRIRGRVTKNELRIVLRTARDSYQELLELWKESQP